MSAIARLFDWRDPARVRSLATAFALMQAAVLALMIAGTHGWLGRLPKPVTTDYVSFYAAGQLANHGEAARAYDAPGEAGARSLHWRTEEAATAPGVDYQYFFNPPPYLLIMAPLARLPYLASFLLVQAVTLALWLAVGTRVAGGGPVAPLALLAVPSVWWVLGLGQNSFLTASLMGLGLLALPARPILAGLAFGALCYKPHLAILVPVALLAAGAWRAIAAAAAMVAAETGATLLFVGPSVWQAFLASAQRSLHGPIDSGKVLLAGRADPTGALQFLGASAGAARLAWAAVALLAALAVIFLWRRGGRETRGAGLASAALIAAPFVLMYDLILASLAAAWLVRAGRARGFLPGERAGLGVALMANLCAAHPFVAATHIPFAVIPGPVLLVLAVRRAAAEGGFSKISAGTMESFIASPRERV